MLRSLLLATTLALPLPALAQDADTVLATVGETEITLGNLIALRARLPEQYQQLPDEVLFQGMLDQLIQQQVLADVARTQMTEADTLGVENETRAFLAGRQIDRLSSAPLDEADVQAAYEAQYGSVDAETEWNASHILVDTPEEARAVAAMLNDGSDFAQLAREKSTGPSGPNGGQLGWFGAGQMVPEFETAVSGMEAGDVSEPVQTQFGWHVVKLNETRLKEAPPIDEVRDVVEQGLREQALDAAIGALTDAANINRVEVDFDPAIIRSVDLLE